MPLFYPLFSVKWKCLGDWMKYQGGTEIFHQQSKMFNIFNLKIFSP